MGSGGFGFVFSPMALVALLVLGLMVWLFLRR
jgi:hypothetical protein